MSERIANVLRGMGTVLELYPNPERRARYLATYQWDSPPEVGIYDAWRSVGFALLGARQQLVEEGESQEPQARRN